MGISMGTLNLLAEFGDKLAENILLDVISYSWEGYRPTWLACTSSLLM